MGVLYISLLSMLYVFSAMVGVPHRPLLPSLPTCLTHKHTRKGLYLLRTPLPRTPPDERMTDRVSMCGPLSLRATQRERKPPSPSRLPRCDVGKPFDGVYPPSRSRAVLSQIHPSDGPLSPRPSGWQYELVAAHLRVLGYAPHMCTYMCHMHEVCRYLGVVYYLSLDMA